LFEHSSEVLPLHEVGERVKLPLVYAILADDLFVYDISIEIYSY